METQALKKFCPVCKLSNEEDALVCRHCGAPLTRDADVPTTQRVEDSFELTEEIKEQVTREHTPPSRGIALYLLNRSEPIALRTEEEFVLGRAGEETTEPTVDLSPFEAYALGVSRRHVLVKSMGDKYMIIDLNSTNGAWLNGQRLVPTKAYDLPSGSTIQLGRLKLVISYLHPSVSKK